MAGGADGWAPGVLAEWSHTDDRGIVVLDDGRRVPVAGIAITGLSVTAFPGLRVLVRLAVGGGRVQALAEAFEGPKPAA